MPVTVEQLAPDLLALPDADCAELACVSIESLGPAIPEMEDVAFDEMLARRADDIRNGRAAGISADELFARLDARLDATGR